MDSDETSAPLTEPPPLVQCVFVTGFAVDDSFQDVIRLVGWTQLPALGGETEERRIVMRCATTDTIIQTLYDALGDAMRRRRKKR